MNYTTEQEAFWAGEFGDEYIGRNISDNILAYNLHFFARSLRHANGIGSVIEFGANVGMNLKAMKLLAPNQEQFGIEINCRAAQKLELSLPKENIFRQSILDFSPERTWDLALVKTVLIHINPIQLPKVYRALHRSARRYILVAEYYSPMPVDVTYRGHEQRLFKRDFAGELLDMFSDLRLADYGFVYRNDTTAPQDDITWFLLEKQQNFQR